MYSHVGIVHAQGQHLYIYIYIWEVQDCSIYIDDCMRTVCSTCSETVWNKFEGNYSYLPILYALIWNRTNSFFFQQRQPNSTFLFPPNLKNLVSREEHSRKEFLTIIFIRPTCLAIAEFILAIGNEEDI